MHVSSTSASSTVPASSTPTASFKCYQTTTRNGELPFDSNASVCLAGMNACALLIDAATNTVQRGCQKDGCTLNGALDHPGFCHFVSEPTFNARDGCNFSEQTIARSDGSQPPFTSFWPPFGRPTANEQEEPNKQGFEMNG
ncbi:hypothetical protein M3Y99_01773500 [Aphelenchoides fujianensis]|nr:hypothetical protein M3Y99_01773500 [Aphelenchoides fujianensis]